MQSTRGVELGASLFRVADARGDKRWSENDEAKKAFVVVHVDRLHVGVVLHWQVTDHNAPFGAPLTEHSVRIFLQFHLLCRIPTSRWERRFIR
jgi:hypothetical protein